MAEYAKKVERMKPASTETIQHRLGSELKKEIDFYVRFAKVEEADSDFADYEGSERKGKTTFLAGGVFEPSRDFDGAGRKEIGFDLTSCDLSNWPALHGHLHPEGMSFRERILFDECQFKDCIDALHGVTTTIVAINRKTLETSIVFACDSHYCIDVYGLGENDEEGNMYTQGTMTPYEWEHAGDEVLDDLYFDPPMRFGDYYFYGDRWQFALREND